MKEWIGSLSLAGLLIAAIVGWILNIVDVAHASEFTVLVILRIVGIFIPIIGAVLGYVL